MRREIDILMEAVRKSCWVVEKDSHVLWTPQDLAEARAAGLYQDACGLLAPDDLMEVGGPFPGCCQATGALARAGGYRPLGQTEHFIIFLPAEDE
jgi:hypothetical protein